jgi:uncharacterized protein
VLIVEYRGYGLSQGTPSERGIGRDARAAYDHLMRERGIDPRRLVLYGESLGGAVAVDLAVRVPVGGLVLENTFTSIADVGRALVPYLPMRLVLRDRYESLEKIGRLEAPLLVFHSRDDEIFPPHHAERLLAAARGPKQGVELRGGHNDAFLVSRAAYEAALERFFSSVLSIPPS